MAAAPSPTIVSTPLSTGPSEPVRAARKTRANARKNQTSSSRTDPTLVAGVSTTSADEVDTVRRSSRTKSRKRTNPDSGPQPAAKKAKQHSKGWSDLVPQTDGRVMMVNDKGVSEGYVTQNADGDPILVDENGFLTHRGHLAWVQNVKPHPTMMYQFLSASVEGEVKLWDIRGRTDQVVTTWNLMQDVGLSAFDVHSTAKVFAGSSAITNTRYRSQRLSFRSLVAEHDEPLSQYNISTGLVTAPVKPNPSPYIPRASSFVFHPTEMLCGVGESDGSIRIVGCNLAT
ncbi:hypothetical protein C8R42DRAFT_720726 [Lentinula raphanica]|nr:hypothetical protein C8R42DRAFT_720726 [Lentinula raphanica]